jgi:maleylpyruvate isomerase
VSEHFDPAPDSAALADATAALLATATTLTDADLRAPSYLPGWSRGHLLTHLARNADAYRRMLDGADRGVPVSAYDSREQRDADIEAGADRGIAVQLADLETASRAFADSVAAMRPDAWSAMTLWPTVDPRPASALLDGRIREVAIHHVDLDVGYSSADWSVPLAAKILASVAGRFDALEMPASTLAATDADVLHVFGDGSGPVVEGPSHALAWWLLGRGDGAALTSSSGGLPAPPAWL